MSQQLTSMVMMVVLFGAMYFLMIRPQKKKDKEVKAMRESLSQGDEVITIGGIHGKVVKVNDEVITLEMAYGKQRINFSKWAIGSVAKKGKGSKADEVIEESPEVPEVIEVSDEKKGE
jgi:preprotein translocase subunit YajC